MAEFVEVIKQAERLCNSYKECDKCDLSGRCSLVSLGSSVEVEEYEKIVMEWVKENPEITNADKFKEVFGVNVEKGSKGCSGIDCSLSLIDCETCQYAHFGNKPYVEPKGSE